MNVGTEQQPSFAAAVFQPLKKRMADEGPASKIWGRAIDGRKPGDDDKLQSGDVMWVECEVPDDLADVVAAIPGVVELSVKDGQGDPLAKDDVRTQLADAGFHADVLENAATFVYEKVVVADVAEAKVANG